MINGTGYDISFGTPMTSLAVGTTVYLKENGVRKEWIIVNIGQPTYDSVNDTEDVNPGYAYGDTVMYNNADGIWLMRKDCLDDQMAFSLSNNYYPGSIIDTFFSNTFMNRLEVSIRNLILTVKIPYADAGSWFYYHCGPHGMSTKIFALCSHEMGCHRSNFSKAYGPNYGFTLAYFKPAVGKYDQKRVKCGAGIQEVYYWCRDSVINNQFTEGNYGMIIGGNDGGKMQERVNGTNYVCPSLVLPKSAQIDSDMNVIA